MNKNNNLKTKFIHKFKELANDSPFNFISIKSTTENSESTDSKLNGLESKGSDFTVDLLLSTKETSNAKTSVENYSLINEENGKLSIPSTLIDNVYSSKNLVLKSSLSIKSLVVTINDKETKSFDNLNSKNTNYILEDLDFKADDTLKFKATYEDNSTKEKIIKISQDERNNLNPSVETSNITYDHSTGDYLLNVIFKDSSSLKSLDNNIYKSIRVMIDGFSYDYSNYLSYKNGKYTFKLPLSKLGNDVFKESHLNIGIYSVDKLGYVFETLSRVEFNKSKLTISTSLNENKIYNNKDLQLKFGSSNSEESKNAQDTSTINFDFNLTNSDKLTNLMIDIIEPDGKINTINALNTPTFKLQSCGDYKIKVKEFSTLNGFTKNDLESSEFTVKYDNKAPIVQGVKYNTKTSEIIYDDVNNVNLNEVPAFSIEDINLSAQSFNNFLRSGFKVILTNKSNPNGKTLNNVTLSKVDSNKDIYILNTTDDSKLDDGDYKVTLDGLKDDANNVSENQTFNITVSNHELSEDDISYTISYDDPNSTDGAKDIVSPNDITGQNIYYFNNGIYIDVSLSENYAEYNKATFSIDGHSEFDQEINNISNNKFTIFLSKEKFEALSESTEPLKANLTLESSNNSSYTTKFNLLYDDSKPKVSFFDDLGNYFDINEDENLSVNSNVINLKFNELIKEANLSVNTGSISNRGQYYKITGDSYKKEETILLTGTISDLAGNLTEVNYQINLDEASPELTASFPKNALGNDTSAYYGKSDESGTNVSFFASLNKDLDKSNLENKFILDVKDFDIKECIINLTKYNSSNEKIYEGSINLNVNNDNYMSNLLLNDGEYYTISAVATDASGNRSSNLYSINADHSAPEVTLIRLPNNANELNYDELLEYKINSIDLLNDGSKNPNINSYLLSRNENIGVLIKDRNLLSSNFINGNITYYAENRSYHLNYSTLNDNVQSINDSYPAKLLKLDTNQLKNLDSSKLQGINTISLNASDALKSYDYKLAFVIDDKEPDFSYDFEDLNGDAVYLDNDKNRVIGAGNAKLNLELPKSYSPYSKAIVKFADNDDSQKEIDLSNLDVSKEQIASIDLNFNDYIDSNNYSDGKKLSITLVKATGKSTTKELTAYLDSNKPFFSFTYGSNELEPSVNGTHTTIDENNQGNTDLVFEVDDDFIIGDEVFNNFEWIAPDKRPNNSNYYVELESMSKSGDANFKKENVTFIQIEKNKYKLAYNKGNNGIHDIKLTKGKYEFKFVVKDYAGNTSNPTYTLIVEDKNAKPTLMAGTNSSKAANGKFYIRNSDFTLESKLPDIVSNFTQIKLEFFEQWGVQIPIYTVNSCSNTNCNLSNKDEIHKFNIPIDELLKNSTYDRPLKVRLSLTCDNIDIGTIYSDFDLIYDNTKAKLDLYSSSNPDDAITESINDSYTTIQQKENSNFIVKASDEKLVSSLEICDPNTIKNVDDMPNSSILLLNAEFNNTSFNDSTSKINGATLKRRIVRRLDSPVTYEFLLCKNDQAISLEQGKYILDIAVKDQAGNLTQKKYITVVDEKDFSVKLVPNNSEDANAYQFGDKFFINNNNFTVDYSIPKTYFEYENLTVKFFEGNNINEASKLLSEKSFENPPNTGDLQSLYFDAASSVSTGCDTITAVFEVTSKDITNSEKKVTIFKFIRDTESPTISVSETNTTIPEGISNFYPYFGVNPELEVSVDDINIDLENLNLNNNTLPNSLAIDSFKLKDFSGENKPDLNNFEIKKLNGKFIITTKNDRIHNFENGDYELTVSASDKSNNRSTYTYKFTVDKSEPSISDINITPIDDTSVTKHNDIYYVNGNFKTNFKINDSVSPHKELTVKLFNGDINTTPLKEYIVRCSKHGANCNGDLSNTGDHDIDIDNTFDFNYYDSNNLKLVIELKNANGLSTVSEPISIRSTKTKPSISLNYDGKNVNTNSIFSKSSPLFIMINDENIDIKEINKYTNESTNNLLPNSINLKSAKIQDLYNNTTDITDEFNIRNNDDNSLVLYKNNSKYELPTGKYTFEFEAKNLCGNVSEIQRFEFIVDTKKTSGKSTISYRKVDHNSNTTINVNDLNDKLYIPYNATLKLNLDGNISGFNSSNSYISVRNSNNEECISSLRPNGDGIDNNGNISEDKSSKSLSLFFNTEGEYKVSWNLSAKNGIESYSGSVIIVVDHTNPDIKLNINGRTGSKGDLNFTNKVDHSVSYKVTDTNFANVTKVSYKNDFDSSSTEGIISSELYNEGEYSISVTAKDKSGRYSTEKINLIVDRTEPNISLPSESNYNSVNNTYYSNKVIPYNYNVTDLYLETEAAYVNGAIYNKSYSVSGDGTKNIKITAKDIAGNTSTKEFSYILDTVAPSLSYSDIEINKYYNKPVKPSFKATDANFNNDSLIVKLNGNKYNNEVISKDGNYSFNLSSTDYAGNTSTLKIPFIIDTVAPVITIQGILENKLNGGTLKPTISVDDKDAILTLLLNGDNYYGSPIFGNGKYSLIASAIDKAGNVSRKVISFMLDSFLPDISIDGIKDGEEYTSAVYPKFSAEKGAKLDVLLNGKPYDGKPITEAGDYVFEVTATDAVGNVNKKIVSFKLTDKSESATETFIDKIISSDDDTPIVPIVIGFSFLVLLLIILIILNNKKKQNE